MTSAFRLTVVLLSASLLSACGGDSKKSDPTPGPAASLTLTGVPAAATAGVSASVTVTAVDASGKQATGYRGTVHLTSTDPAAVLPADLVFAEADAGERTFAVAWRTAGGRDLTATDVANPALTATESTAVTAADADATASSVSALPATLTVGTEAVLTATVRDLLGNPVPGVTVTFDATGTDNAITQPTGVTDSAGTATGSLSTTSAGPRTVSALAGALPLTARPVVTFSAGPADQARSSAVGSPASVVADGTALATVTVTLLDAYDNPVPGTWVALSSSRGLADLLSSWWETTDAAGTVTFAARSTVAGTSTFTAVVSGLTPVSLPSSVTFVAGPVSATRSTVVSSPGTVNADGNSPAIVTVTLLDASGNPVSGKEVALVSSRGADDTVAPPSGVSDAAGAVTFTATSAKFGVSTFTATDTTDSLAMAQMARIDFAGTVSPSRSTVVAATTSVLANGSASTVITVRVLDTFGHPVAGEAVALASSRGAVDTISPASATTDAVGQVVFAITSRTLGVSTVTATVTAFGMTPTSTPAVTFVSYLVFSTQPTATATSGNVIDPPIVVTARDAEGNTDAAFASDVTLAIGANPSGATLSGTLTVAPVGGVATFSDLFVDKTGSNYTLTASTTATGIPTATSAPFSVVPGSPAALVFAVQPSNSGAGIAPMIQVAIQDARGNTTNTTGADVVLSLGANPGGATLGGALTAQSVAGIATFARLSLSATGAGYTLVASDPLGSMTPATSQPFDFKVAVLVGSGTPASCTEAALVAALAAGGHQHFNCGPDPVTITLTSTKTPGVNVGLDGGGLVTLSGGATVQLFSITNPAVTLGLENLTITAGRTGGNGGAIYGVGTLSLSNCTVSESVATRVNDYYGTSANGGAIFNNGGTLLVMGATFTNNQASSDWDLYGVSANGGAIFNNGAGKLLVANSTFRGNTASGSNSFYGTAGNGGAIFNSGGRLWMVNSTLAGNAVYSSSNYYGTGGQGGAIFGGGTLSNTLVAAGPSGANCSGTFVDGGHNLDSGGSCGVGPATNPLLAAAGLASNGGPTQTIALQATSPAIDAGDGAICAAAPVSGLDQRGYQRPGTGATACSIGAFEYASPGPP